MLAPPQDQLRPRQVFVNVQLVSESAVCLSDGRCAEGSLVFQGMEVDCTPEDLSKCSYEERCVELGEVKDMRLEAEAVVNDVLFAVTDMRVSHSLSSGLDVAYINLETREGQRYCLELTEAGLRVVGHVFDQVHEELSTQYHETVYSLLDSLSPGYREAFGNALLQRLERLKQNGQ